MDPHVGCTVLSTLGKLTSLKWNNALCQLHTAPFGASRALSYLTLVWRLSRRTCYPVAKMQELTDLDYIWNTGNSDSESTQVCRRLQACPQTAYPGSFCSSTSRKHTLRGYTADHREPVMENMHWESWEKCSRHSSRPLKHFEGSRQLISTKCQFRRRGGSDDRTVHTGTHGKHTYPRAMSWKQRECSGTGEIYNLRLVKSTHRQTESKSVAFKKWKPKLSQPPPHNKAHKLKLHTCNSVSVIASKIMPLK